MNKKHTVFLSALLLLPTLSATAEDMSQHHALVVNPEDVTWSAGPTVLPAGAQMAVLDGDPSKEGPFVMRLKGPDGYQIPLHTHDGDERVTVIQGTFVLTTHHCMNGSHEAKGGMHHEEHCMTEEKRIVAGGYFSVPANLHHTGRLEGETILQINGMGPWSLNLVP